MRKFSGIFMLACLVAAPAAFAGSLTLDSGQAAWHSTQCAKPVSPDSVLQAHPETRGDDMNALIAQHNAFVDASQIYMNCVSNEAGHDQSEASKAIAAGAQNAIAEMQSEVNSSAPPVRRR